ncbi:MAG: hypothetical protein LBI18_02890 [Planctomycetaceae bacterium]|nr:hypothetical protein [Planctomycetaceae bacterium]
MNEFDNQFHHETPEEAAIRLRAKIAAGESYLKPELAKVLMLSAQQSAVNRQYEEALFRVDEALDIAEKLIENDQIELQTFLVPCFLFRATITLVHRGTEAGLVAFNEAIQYFIDKTDRHNPLIQNGVAVALVNKAKILTNPLGAYSTAIAAQEQAVKIWQHLLVTDSTEYRQQLITALLECGDLKISCGNPEKALPDFREALEIVQTGITDGRTELYPILIQVLLKLTKLYDQLGDLPNAFYSVRESIQIVHDLVNGGESQAKLMLTTLYLQHGILLDQRDQHALALEEFDRCRDVYHEILRWNDKPIAGNYVLRIGLANVLMYRGNMLSALERYDEAMIAFDESTKQYQHAAEFRPENDDDETFIPYSIGIVQLNQASMFVAQAQWEKALELKTKALQAFHLRLEAGHDEILPNLVSAYRKMMTILQKLGKHAELFTWLKGLRKLLESVIEEGKLEFRNDLASVYHLYCVLWEEQDNLFEAEQNALQSLRILRSIADEETDAPQIHFAKIQWSELLKHVAFLRTRQHRLGDAVRLFQNAIDDVTGLMNEGNKAAVYDVLLAYSQFTTFMEVIVDNKNDNDDDDCDDEENDNDVSDTDSDTELNTEPESDSEMDSAAVLQNDQLPELILRRLEAFSAKDTDTLPEGTTPYSSEYFRDWIDQTLKVCSLGIELIRQQQIKRNEQSINQFFSTKMAFFHKTRSSLFLLRNDLERAREELSLAAEQWELLLLGLEKLKAKNAYFALESGTSDGNVMENDFGETYRNRSLYFVGELRSILQSWANTCLTLNRFEEAEHIFNREIDSIRKLVQQEIPNADRFLILSLVNYAKAVENSFSIARALILFDEARQLVRKRLRQKAIISDDYALFVHVYLAYSLFLIKNGKADYVAELMSYYVEDMKISVAIRSEFPSASIWLELCRAFEVHTLWLTDPMKRKNIRVQQRQLLAQHPEFYSDSQLREWDQQLAKELEKESQSEE